MEAAVGSRGDVNSIPSREMGVGSPRSLMIFWSAMHSNKTAKKSSNGAVGSASAKSLQAPCQDKDHLHLAILTIIGGWR